MSRQSCRCPRIGLAGLMFCFVGAPADSSVEPDDLEFAVELLEANQIIVEPSTVRRVLRDEIETVIWLEARHEGLPVFFHDVGYVFEADGSPSRYPGSDEPIMLGEPLPGTNAFPIDLRPDVEEAAAFDVYLQRVRQPTGHPIPAQPPEKLRATLGLHNLHLGSAHPAEYRLAWKVEPECGGYPFAIVDAKKGNLLFYDSGIRTSTMP